jgi:DNA polymerase bacteriophage-type
MTVENGDLCYWAKDPDRPHTRLQKKYIWGGLLTENIIQSIARDVMACAMQRLRKAGIKVTLTVHDEIVCSVTGASDRLKFIEHLMTIRPEWAKGLPLAVESKVSFKYKK